MNFSVGLHRCLEQFGLQLWGSVIAIMEQGLGKDASFPSSGRPLHCNEKINVIRFTCQLF